MSYTFKTEELEQITSYGLTKEKVLEQIKLFKKGIPFTNLYKTCEPEKEIKILKEEEFSELLNLFEKEVLKSRIMKFVPASGAASRMFKSLQCINNEDKSITIDLLSELSKTNKDAKEVLTFVQGINKFAFLQDLSQSMKNSGLDLESDLDKGEFKNIIDFVISDKGLNYANLPKGIIKFHSYNSNYRTAFEEHLVEGLNYAKDKENRVKLHFTISPEHLENVKDLISNLVEKYKTEQKVNFNISYSIQKPSTDTIAVDLDNNPFTDKDKLLFRPAGHGALLENLNDTNGDIIFIKNIDNVVPDSLKEETYKYKKLLAGYLIKTQNTIFDYLNKLEQFENDELIDNAIDFVKSELYIDIPQNIENKKDWIIKILNRPIRVCGMVKNQGEPGGGPFVVDNNGFKSLQIVETSQIDINNPEQKDILSKSSHFNPVDLVCGIRDYKNEVFDLNKFVDYNTCFISLKSKSGRDLKAMELPGLWNGSMAYWNTIFIEVPLITFNPVKTINDLLKHEHQ
jgi:hypothetical protein